MRTAAQAALIAALLTSACGPGVSGSVRDASTGTPIPGATVELSDLGWGMRGGQIVWDAEHSVATTTDAAGNFAFDKSGGISLRVTAAGLPPLETSLCPRSPSLVRVGGPYPGLRAGETLRFVPAGNGAPTWKSELGLTASGSTFGDGSHMRIEAVGGVRFVAGTGAIPPAPALPYESAADLDLTADCGWLFVADGVSPVAAIRVGPLAWEEEPGGPRNYLMLFARLPRADSAMRNP